MHLAHGTQPSIFRAPRLHLHRVLVGRTVPVSLGFFYPAFYLVACASHLTVERVIYSQVLENARRQSVEGLAFPFLMNWLLGEYYTLRAPARPQCNRRIAQYVACAWLICPFL